MRSVLTSMQGLLPSSLGSGKTAGAPSTGNLQTSGKRGLNGFERSRIDKAIQKAFKELPENLVRGMANIPPATEEVARLAGSTIEALQNERNTAIGMITLHTVMKRVIKVRNDHWVRGERENMSDQIDAYAREAVLRELKKLRNGNFEKLKSAVAHIAHGAVDHYVIGVSAREVEVLDELSFQLMYYCRNKTDGDPSEAEQDIYKNLSLEDARQIYLTLDAAMIDAFSELFTVYDQRVRKGSLVGVDHAEVKSLALALKVQWDYLPVLDPGLQQSDDSLSTPPDDIYAALPEQQRNAARAAYSRQFPWLDQQKNLLSTALDEACSRLPAHLRNVARAAYGLQFQRFHDYRLLGPNAAALWKIRDDRKEQAHSAKPAPITRRETDAWVDKAMLGLTSILEEYDSSAVVGDSSPASANETPEAIDASGVNHSQNGERSATHSPLGGEHDAATAARHHRKFKGTFSDLRAAYEGNRSDLPWHDTRAQEAMEKMAGPALKNLLPQNRATALEAMTAYGKSSMQFLLRRGLKIESIPKSDMVITEDDHAAVYAETLGETSPSTYVHIPEFPDAEFTRWDTAPSVVDHRVKLGILKENTHHPRVKMASDSKSMTLGAVQHELPHAFDMALSGSTGLQRFKPAKLPLPFPLSLPFILDKWKGRSRFYSVRDPVIREEHAKAARDKTGLTRYAESNTLEFLAELMSAYLGEPNFYYETNVRKENTDVFSPENLQEQHPRTYALIDELVRSGFNLSRAKRSLKGKTSMADKLRRQIYDAREAMTFTRGGQDRSNAGGRTDDDNK
jgi:hypothetical protein